MAPTSEQPPMVAPSQPAIDGWLHPDFDGVAAALRAQLRSYSGGAAVCVYHRGRCVVDLWGGVQNRHGAPWMHDTMAPSFSTTKGVAATLLHIAVSRGLLDYDDRVAQHWPEFGQAGKESISVRQVLAHQSGLYHIRQMIDRADRMLDWDYMIQAIERAQPIHEPGTRTGYHGLTFGYIVGEILQRVTGRRSRSSCRMSWCIRCSSMECTSALPRKPCHARRSSSGHAATSLTPVSAVAQGWIASALLAGGSGRCSRARPRRRAARPRQHPRRARAERHQCFRLRRGRHFARRDPSGQRPVHGALAGAHVRGARRRRRARRRASPVGGDARACDRGAELPCRVAW